MLLHSEIQRDKGIAESAVLDGSNIDYIKDKWYPLLFVLQMYILQYKRILNCVY